MAHYSRLAKVVVDVPPDAHADELDFWQGAVGLPMTRSEESPEFHGAKLRAEHFGILVQRLDFGEPRVHLDIHTDDVEAEVERLVALGAKRARQVNGLWILLDPAGIPFCVIPMPPETFDEGNATRWE
ncbi:VOC family protein [Phytomonospora sp. NPDC050363]|uniref:VOC family protein n=1 Tax=Phytomonospora sp. NPDC050363 TaxID=3155642 RepID=UPI0033CE7632